MCLSERVPHCKRLLHPHSLLYLEKIAQGQEDAQSRFLQRRAQKKAGRQGLAAQFGNEEDLDFDGGLPPPAVSNPTPTLLPPAALVGTHTRINYLNVNGRLS